MKKNPAFTIIGVFLCCLMGYFGGIFDLIFQRIVEIWTFTTLVIHSYYYGGFNLHPSIGLLLIIFTFFNWTGITWLMRAEVYREKGRQYCEAARSMGASHLRIIFFHLLPNSLVPLVNCT